MTVGIVLISHSRALAEGAAVLVSQMSAGTVPVLPAGGTDEGGLGTSSALITAAIEAADRGAGVLLIPDLGSSVLSAKALLDERDETDGPRLVLADAPFVEGAVAAAVAAHAGMDLDSVAGAAEEARDFHKL